MDTITFPEGCALIETRRALLASPWLFSSDFKIDDGLVVRVSGPSSVESFGESVGIRVAYSEDGAQALIATWSFELNRLGTFWVPVEQFRPLCLSATTCGLINAGVNL